jgi:hypothetical protein
VHSGVWILLAARGSGGWRFFGNLYWILKI